MVKPDIFKIVFDDPNSVYQSGQHVSGRVELQLSKEKKIMEVFLTVFGGAATHWTKEEGTPENSRIVHYRSREVYVDTSVMLWGNGSAQMIPAGRYSLPFSVFLPHHCLPSFQGRMGKIQYICRARIDRPWRFDYKVKEIFTVLPVCDLNLSPMTAVGLSAENSKSLGCLFCGRGMVVIQIDIPQTGFVPGECIKATVHIDNQSSRQMRSFDIYLIQDAFYTAAGQGSASEEGRNDIRKISYESKLLREIQMPSNISMTMEIPIHQVVATINAKSIIQVKYLLKCKLILMDFSTHLEFRLPIVVGTVPLRHIPTALPLENGNALPSDLPPALSTIQPLSAEPPPPSYEECMFGEVDARDDADNEPMGRNFAFAPKYPVYRVWTEF